MLKSVFTRLWCWEKCLKITKPTCWIYSCFAWDTFLRLRFKNIKILAETSKFRCNFKKALTPLCMWGSGLSMSSSLEVENLYFSESYVVGSVGVETGTTAVDTVQDFWSSWVSNREFEEFRQLSALRIDLSL